jgi:NADH-quinone oxidoreductase subunit F
MDLVKNHILVCTGGGCVASGALEVSASLKKAVDRFGLTDDVSVVETGCLGPCAVGPVALVYPDGILYENLKPEYSEEIVEEHLLKGRVVERIVHQAKPGEDKIREITQSDFFKKQVKIVLRNCGLIDPVRIEEYIAQDGYGALAKVLTEMTPEEVVDAVKRSGLRGRGGAGFPTGLKWEFCRRADGEPKYVLCNADEGDPGAFMDRSILEGDPHSVIEAMAIAAYAIGAGNGYIYVRAEYPLAVKRLSVALEQAREYGLLGPGILGTAFGFDLEIRMGSGAFVCGEETALMTSIEGNRGEPRPRPPFPANKGLWNKPSLLNNVETYANIPIIILKGPELYASFGTENSRGTKVFALAGAVENTGLVEVPIGTPLGEIVYDIGGGLKNKKPFKAAQIGGPSGGCIPKQYLNTPVDYESLAELGAIMGSGGMIIMDEDTCMVDIARFFLEFVQEESCGKCSPCRIGTRRMLEILTRICEGKGEEGDIEKLIELGNTIKDTALCGLGQTAPNPVLSAIRHFRDEFIAHIKNKRCPAGVCPEIVRAPCQNNCPAGVDIPGYVSLIGEKRYDDALRLHRERNPFAAVCSRVCFHRCEDKCRRQTIDEPVSIRVLKRFMADQEKKIRFPEIRGNEENRRRKVAVIGAGPAGLSCAYFLARLGYRPDVFEAMTEPGGMLVQAIPAYRLPRDILRREIGMIRDMGVHIETGVRLGEDFTLEKLKSIQYEAVFMGIGAPDGIGMSLGGLSNPRCVQAISFLREYNLKGSVPVGKKVCVVGGGNAAIDAARTALRLGAESVRVLYRRTRSEMPAYAEEVAEAEKEGVLFSFLVSPYEIVSSNGGIDGIRCQCMDLGEFDKSGRKRPVQNGTEYSMEADQLILAIGQALNTEGLFGGMDIGTGSSNFIEVDPITGQTSIEWVFAGGDAVNGPSSVADAVAGGERGAAGIDLFLAGEDRVFWRTEKEVDISFDPDEDPVEYGRSELKTISLAARKGNFSEVELSWKEPVALKEAKRCLRCDYREREE